MAAPTKKLPLKYLPGTVTWLGYVCRVRLEQYSRGNGTALILEAAQDYPAADPLDEPVHRGQRIAVASVNLPDIPTGHPGFVHLKTWGENEGILEALQAVGMVESTGITHRTGFVAAPLVTIPALIAASTGPMPEPPAQG